MRRIAQLLLVKPSESKAVSFFILLFSLLGAGLAVGKGSADALFLKRYGVEYFPYVYMVLSVALAVSSTVYAAYVDRISSERFFRMIFVIMAAILVFLQNIMGFIVGQTVDLEIIINSCLAAAIALGMSGFSSAYVSEEAERKHELVVRDVLSLLDGERACVPVDRCNPGIEMQLNAGLRVETLRLDVQSLRLERACKVFFR